MKINDTIQIYHINDHFDTLVCLGSTGNQHLVAKKTEIVNNKEESIFWAGDFGVKSFFAINKKHNFIQIDGDNWKLDIEPIEKGDLE
jgi:hypothetical protein